jgi:membrane protein DedA with SNARE-associated domain
MIGDFIHWLIQTVSTLGYPGIVVLMAIESSVLPLPSELIMPPAGYLAAKGQMNAYAAVLAGTAGSILGALVNYALAVFVGEPILRRYGKYVLISERSLDKAERFFKRHGEIGTLLGRLVPVVRHLISIPAGICRMNLARFVLFTGVGAGVWCAILVYIGWLLGSHEQGLQEAAVKAYTHQALLYLLPVVALVVAGYVVWHRRRPQSSDRVTEHGGA